MINALYVDQARAPAFMDPLAVPNLWLLWLNTFDSRNILTKDKRAKIFRSTVEINDRRQTCAPGKSVWFSVTAYDVYFSLAPTISP